jgi:hypothetical protein
MKKVHKANDLKTLTAALPQQFFSYHILSLSVVVKFKNIK